MTFIINLAIWFFPVDQLSNKNSHFIVHVFELMQIFEHFRKCFHVLIYCPLLLFLVVKNAILGVRETKTSQLSPEHHIKHWAVLVEVSSHEFSLSAHSKSEEITLTQGIKQFPVVVSQSLVSGEIANRGEKFCQLWLCFGSYRHSFF